MLPAMQIETLDNLLAKYSELTAVQVVLLIVVLATVYLIVQTWINRSRIKAAAVVAETKAESEAEEAKQRDQMTATLMSIIARMQEHQEAAEKRSIEARSDAHIALNKMAEAVAGIGKLIELHNQSADQRNGELMAGIQRITDIAEQGSPPVKALVITSETLLAQVERLGADLKTMSDDTTGKLDQLIEGMATVQMGLSRVKRDIELAQEAITNQIKEACAEKEKRKTDSKPIVILPLPPEDDPDKLEATG